MKAIVVAYPISYPDELLGIESKREYEEMLFQILQNSSAELMFYSYENTFSIGFEDNQFFYDHFPRLEAFRSRVRIMPLNERLMKYDIDHIDPGDISVWTRDYSPYPMKPINNPNANLEFMSFVAWTDKVQKNMENSIPRQLSASLNTPLTNSSMILEGGNFMTTTDGICASAKGPERYLPNNFLGTLESLMNCRDLVHIEGLPGIIRHIDMYAQFVSDQDVLIADIPDNRFDFDGNISICFEWGKPCAVKQLSIGSGLFTLSGVLQAARDFILTLKPDQTIAYFDKGLDGRLTKVETEKLSDLKGLVDNWEQSFVSNGFAVKRVMSPRPSIRIHVTESRNKEIVIGFAADFSSYINTLIYNGSVFVPQYKAQNKLNENAIKAYDEYSHLQSFPIEVDKLVHERGGSVHCMTKAISW